MVILNVVKNLLEEIRDNRRFLAKLGMTNEKIPTPYQLLTTH